MSDPARTANVAVSLESVLSTDELYARPSRPPDYQTENRALLAIAQQLAESPQTTLQKLAEVALEICRAGSAGVSLISKDTGDFYWPAIAGAWKPYIGGGTPRHFGPCGVVLDHNAVQLFTRPERYYPYLVSIAPPIAEALLTPFYVEGKAVGTVWVVAHDPARKFDAEDICLIESLGRFAAAYPLCVAVHVQEQQSQSLRDINEELLVSSVHQHELTEQAQKAETALRESEERLALELTATQRLQEISTQLISEDHDEALYEQILDAAVAIVHSDMASIQVLDESEDALRMLIFRGFDADFGGIFELNRPDTRTSCSAARREGRRVVVPDVETCDFIVGTPALEDHRKTGIRAVQSTPLLSRGGRLLGMISTHWRNPHQPAERDLRLLDVLARQAADLIERSQSERALRESEERIRTLVSVITDVPWTANAEGQFTTPQPAWAAYTGQSWDELRGFGWANALHLDDRTHILKLWDDACKARTLYRSSGRVWHAATRQYRYFQARATPLLNKDGTLREWVGTCTDVEEQKRAEEVLRDSADRLSFMAESMPQKIFTAKPNGDVDYFNQQWMEFTGMALDQIRNWGWTQIVHADDIGENIRLWKHAIDTGEPFQVVHRLKRADGSYRWHLSRAHAMRDASGKVSMWIGSNTNIHDQKEREDQLPETQKLAVGAYPFRAKPAAPRSTGETLRSERLRRGWTLKQVTAETKISTHLLEALEEDRFDRLPYGLLTRNFVRQYAHVLGLDEAAALASLKQQLDALAPPPPEPRRKSIIKIPHLPPLRFRLKLEQELAFGLRLAAAGGLRLCQGRRWCAGLRTHVAVLRRLLGRAAAPLIMSGLKKER